MSFDITATQGDTAPSYTLELSAYGGVGTWLAVTDTVEALYAHFDDSTATATLSITAYGDESTPATVVVPSPCGILAPTAPSSVAIGTGLITITRIDNAGNRESMPDRLTYNVLRP